MGHADRFRKVCGAGFSHTIVMDILMSPSLGAMMVNYVNI